MSVAVYICKVRLIEMSKKLSEKRRENDIELEEKKKN